MTSGAIQNGVPMTVFLFAMVSWGTEVEPENEPGAVIKWSWTLKLLVSMRCQRTSPIQSDLPFSPLALSKIKQTTQSMDWLCKFSLTVSCPATPKSASLAWPSEFSRMFPALMSLWIFLMKWRYSRPFRVACRMVAISSSVSYNTHAHAHTKTHTIRDKSEIHQSTQNRVECVVVECLSSVFFYVHEDT